MIGAAPILVMAGLGCHWLALAIRHASKLTDGDAAVLHTVAGLLNLVSYIFLQVSVSRNSDGEFCVFRCCKEDDWPEVCRQFTVDHGPASMCEEENAISFGFPLLANK
jgi:hypothetical protein